MTRVLMVADGGWPTGFERVARGIGTYLQSTGQFEVIHRGLGFAGGSKTRVPPYPYSLRPIRASSQDPMGVKDLSRWLREDKPDVLLMIQDLWNQTNYLGYVPRNLPTIGYYPVDTPNIKWSYALGAAALTEAVPYTTFGAHETALGVRDAVDMICEAYEAQGSSIDESAAWLTLPKDGMELKMRADRVAARQNISGYRPIPHGIDHTLFTQLDKAECRKVWGFPQDALIVLNVNTNQFRKRQDLTIRAFARLAAVDRRALLVLHSMGGEDKSGWDLAQLARLYGVQDRVICTHWRNPELTDEQLVALYNTADIQINSGGGEGWGLTSVEGALCGVPQLVPDWSATRELWKGSGVLLPVSDYRIEAKYINTAHAIVSANKTAEILIQLAKNPDQRQLIGAACKQHVEALPNWAQVGALFADRIRSALHANDTPGMSLRQIRESREGELRSELLRW